MSGKVVFGETMNAESYQMNTSGFGYGIYFVKVSDDSRNGNYKLIVK